MIVDMVLRALLVLSVLVPGLPAQAASLWSEPLIETIDDQDALPDDNVTALAEDARGLLWIGTPNGLFRYDGYRMRRHLPQADNPHAMTGGFVRALLIDRDGRLWVGTNSDGISILDPRTERFLPLRKEGPRGKALPDDAIRSLALDRDGSVWIGTMGGLARWNRETDRIEHLPSDGGNAAPADNRIFALTIGSDDALWIGSWAGLDRRSPDSGTFQRVPLLPALPDRPAEPSVRSVAASADGAIWVGTLDAEIVVLDPDGSRPRRAHTVDDAGKDVPTSLMLLSAAVAGDHAIWLGGLGGILSCDTRTARCHPPVAYDPNVPHGLGSADIRALLQDRAGHLWMGGYSSGLQRINADNRALRMLRYRPNDPHGLSDASIASVHVGGDRLIYLGTRGRGVDVLDPQRGVMNRITPAPGDPDRLQNGVITALTRTAEGMVWVGTDYGLAYLDPTTQRGRRYLREDGLPSNTIRRLLLDAQQRLWIGTNQGLALIESPDAAIRTIGDQAGGPVMADVNAIVDDAAGGLWIGSIRGLYRIEPGTSVLRRFIDASPAEAAEQAILGLMVDREGALWMDTPKGLYRLQKRHAQPARFEPISAQRGIDGQPFGANLLQDEQGRIWSHRFVYDPATREVHELTRADGADLGTGWFRAYDRDADGHFYFGGSRGLLRIEPARFSAWQYQPPLVITDIRIDGRPVPADPSGVVLDSGEQQLAVEFAALDFTAPQRLRYTYKLEGRDHDWIPSEASQRVASYTNLWPGTYTLRIRGSNRSGDWSTHEIALPVRVQPMLWQTRSAQVIAVAGLVMAGWLLARVYSRRLRARATLLERLVDERTADLSDAKTRAEQAAQDLRATQKQLLESEKAAALGRLVSGVAHEINTPIGNALTATSMLRARGYQMHSRLEAGSVRKADLKQFIDVTLEATELVENSLNRTARLVQTFKTVAVEADHEPRRHFDLDESLSSLCRGLADSWESQGVHYQLECPRHIDMCSYPGALGQVLLALADNAVQHAFDGQVDKRLSISAAPLGPDRVRIIFADNGRGMPADVLARIFEPFFTTRRSQGGTGLGLHVTYQRVTLRMGGTLSASCPTEGGTRFDIELPRTAPELEDPAAQVLPP